MILTRGRDEIRAPTLSVRLAISDTATMIAAVVKYLTMIIHIAFTLIYGFYLLIRVYPSSDKTFHQKPSLHLLYQSLSLIGFFSNKSHDYHPK